MTGYDGDPYLRFRPNRVVEVNLHSPSKYVNEDRFGTLQPPASARPGASPAWKVVSTNGSYKWFDHRIHWMDKKPPAQVKDKAQEDEDLRLEGSAKVDGRPVTASGTLLWIPRLLFRHLQRPLIVAILVVAVLVLLAGSCMLRRRRRPARPTPGREKAPKEAW